MSDDVKELPDGVDESMRGAWEAWLAEGMSENADEFVDSYAGEWLNVEEYVEDFISSCYTIPDWVDGYIDYEQMARDLEICGDFWTANSDTYTLYVFRG